MSKVTARITLKSTLFAGQILPLAKILLANAETVAAERIAAAKVEFKDKPEELEKALKAISSTAVVKELVATFTAAGKEVPAMIKAQAAEAEEAAKAKVLADAASAEEKAKKAEELEKYFTEMHANVKKGILATPGMDEQSAQDAADLYVKTQRAKMAAEAAAASGRGGVKEKVEVEYNGNKYMVAVKGNIPQDVKDALTKTGLSREAFIEQHRTDKAPAAEGEQSEQENAEA